MEELETSTLLHLLLLYIKKGISATLSFLSYTGIGTRKWYLGQVEEEEEPEDGG